jgi:hypothetical protein
MNMISGITLEQATHNAAAAFETAQRLSQQRIGAGGEAPASVDLFWAMKSFDYWKAVVEQLSGARYEPPKPPARARPTLTLIVGGK